MRHIVRWHCFIDSKHFATTVDMPKIVKIQYYNTIIDIEKKKKLFDDLT